MKIMEVVVFVEDNHADRILLKTDVKDACYPFTDYMAFHSNAAKGTGLEWVKKNIPDIPVKVVRIDSAHIQFGSKNETSAP